MTGSYRELQKQIVAELLDRASSRAAGVSTVPIRPDHAADPAICLAAVVLVPPTLAREITSILVDPLREIEPEHHYYPPDAMHLTIKNVRTVHDPPRFTPADVEKVDRLLADLIPRHRSFAFSLEDLVPFSTSVSLVGYCDERLRDLVLALDAGLREIRVPDDKQYVSDTVFFGNVTLCRFSHPPSGRFCEAVEELAGTYRGRLAVETVHLMMFNAVNSPWSRSIVNGYRLAAASKQEDDLLHLVQRD